MDLRECWARISLSGVVMLGINHMVVGIIVGASALISSSARFSRHKLQ